MIGKHEAARAKESGGSISVENTIYDPDRPAKSDRARDKVLSPSQTSSPSAQNKGGFPSRPLPYNPHQLLNPKSSRKDASNPLPDTNSSYLSSTKSLATSQPELPSNVALKKDGSPYFSMNHHRPLGPISPETSSDLNSNQIRPLHFQSGGPRSMLEGLYGVERRADQPQKKMKREVEEADYGARKKASYAYQSNGIVGQYLKSETEGGDAKASIDAQMVDLTQGKQTPRLLQWATVNLFLEDDNDDLVITGSRERDSQEVCYGHVVASIQSHLIPKPKNNSFFGGDNEWPLIKCKLDRTPGKDKKIRVLDPFNTEFGHIDRELSEVLAPAMDGLVGLRTQARILTRRKKGAEWPGQPCSDIIRMIVNIYGPRRHVEVIGKLFGQGNIWFRPPMAPDGHIPICNPHAKRGLPQGLPQGSARRHIHSETRTNEDFAQDISRMFDHFASDAASLPSTEAPAAIITPLLEHQKQALTFLLQREKPRTFGPDEVQNSSLWRTIISAKGEKFFKEIVSGLIVRSEPDQVFGGLLADVMGLGKTIEALALIVATMDEAVRFGKDKLTRGGPDEGFFLCHTKATLLVSPLSAVKNWEDQLAEHVSPGALKYYVYHGSNRIQNAFELSKYDLIITTYGTVSAELTGKSSKEGLSPIRQLKWFRVVLDEAHTIREPRAAQSQAMYSLWAQRRWCLTGTPIQNRIDDLGSLTRFLRLYPYDNAMGFNQYIRAPALVSREDGSFLKTLRVFVDSFTLRRLKDRVDLPKRYDLVDQLRFSDGEQKLHDFFKEQSHLQLEELSQTKKVTGGLQHHVLRSIMTLRLISAHGRELLKEKDLSRLKGISAIEAIDLDEDCKLPTLTKRSAYEHLQMMAEADLDMCRQCDKKIGGDSPQAEADESTEGIRCHVLPCFDVVCYDCFEPYERSFAKLPDDSAVPCPFCHMTIAAQYVPISTQGANALDVVPEETLPSVDVDGGTGRYYGGPHTKTIALLRDIQQMRDDSEVFTSQGEPPLKCVVFSEFTSHLDLIGRALNDNGLPSVRIDGSMSLNRRRKVLDAFSTDDSVTILLASIKAAGQGLNLTAACRAFIMEPMWNPAAEAQAVDRIYRIGQKREVTVKRYHMADSIELKIVELQKKKQALADVSMNRNHKQLNKKEVRDQHLKEILSLFK